MMEHNISTIDKGLFVLTALYAFTALISTAASYALEAIGVILLIAGYRRWPIIWANNKFLIAGVGVFLSGYLITSFTAINRALAVEAIKGQIEPIVLLFMVLAVKWSKRRIAIVAGMLAAGLFVNDCYAFYQWIFTGNDRPAGFAKQAAVLFSEYIGLLLPMVYLVFLRAKSSLTIAISVGLLLFTGALMIADSVKMIWIVTTCAIITLSVSFLFINKGMNFRRILLAPALLAVMAGAVFFSPIVQGRIALAVNEPSSFLRTRTILWDIGERIFIDHKLVGVGPGNYGPEKYYYLDTFHKGAPFNRQIINSHNIIVQTAAEQGVVGLGALSVLIVGIGLTAWNFVKTQRAYLGIGIIVLTGCLFMAGMSEYTMGYKPLMRLYWFLLGVLVSAAWIDRDTAFKGARFR